MKFFSFDYILPPMFLLSTAAFLTSHLCDGCMQGTTSRDAVGPENGTQQTPVPNSNLTGKNLILKSDNLPPPSPPPTQISAKDLTLPGTSLDPTSNGGVVTSSPFPTTEVTPSSSSNTPNSSRPFNDVFDILKLVSVIISTQIPDITTASSTTASTSTTSGITTSSVITTSSTSLISAAMQRTTVSAASTATTTLTASPAQLPTAAVNSESTTPNSGPWSDWLPWNECSATCGGGHWIRVRMCREEPGKCPGKDMEIQGCSSKPCK